MLKISSYEVYGLHDTLNYALPGSGNFQDTVIFYGDNGSGKTTLLNLLFHLLSSSNKNGHRTALAKIPFRQILVKLSDGTLISATRREGALSYPVEYAISRPGKDEIRWSHFSKGHMEQYFRDHYVRSVHSSAHQVAGRFELSPNLEFSQAYISSSFEVSDSASEERFLAELKNLELNLVFITSDRRIMNDALSDGISNDAERSQNQRSDDPIANARTRYLEAALSTAGRWVGKKLIRASNAGSKNSNEIYSELVIRLASADLNENDTTDIELESLRDELNNVSVRNKGYVRYGLAPRLDVRKILDVLNHAEVKNKNAVKMVVRPYIRSLRARLDALEPVYNSIRTFTENLNDFFSGKKITYVAGRGFKISNDREQSLEVGQLSSGEQQLLLIFCYALSIDEQSSCLIIDEPEISLNIKWQRKFVDALKEITLGESSQLIIATHSIELLAQHSDYVCSLQAYENTKNKVVYESAPSND
jgi:energy-coupling factor transporter ATP-binding protein EcfA2